jgi:hypothetical protein
MSCSRLEAVFSTGMAGIGATVLDGLITFPPPLLLLLEWVLLIGFCIFFKICCSLLFLAAILNSFS